MAGNSNLRLTLNCAIITSRCHTVGAGFLTKVDRYITADTAMEAASHNDAAYGFISTAANSVIEPIIYLTLNIYGDITVQITKLTTAIYAMDNACFANINRCIAFHAAKIAAADNT